MGCLFAGKLQAAGHRVTLITREPPPAAALTVRIDEVQGTRELTFPASCARDREPIGHLLVTVKAYDIREAVLGVAHRLTADSQVLLLANGLGFAEELRRELPRPDCYLGSTNAGAFRHGPRHIRHAGEGETRIGRPGCETPPPWFDPWSRAVTPGGWDRDILQTMWHKLALNCVINPLTALHRCRNGELAQPRFARHIAALCEEIAAVSAAVGYPTTPAQLRQRIDRVIAATAQNRSSMLQDVLAGRHTEIDYINGYLAARAQRHGIEVPRNRELLEQIRDMGS